MSFVTSHPGPFIMLAVALLAMVVVLSARVLAQIFLPADHWLRRGIEAIAQRAKENPELAGKRIQQLTLALIAIAFALVTFIYS